MTWDWRVWQAQFDALTAEAHIDAEAVCELLLDESLSGALARAHAWQEVRRRIGQHMRDAEPARRAAAEQPTAILRFDHEPSEEEKQAEIKRLQEDGTL